MESDQAALVGGIFGLHLQSPGHINGEPNPDCAFCKGFIIDVRPNNWDAPFESYSFVIMDVSDKSDNIQTLIGDYGKTKEDQLSQDT